MQNLKQFVPSDFCLGCYGCCRFAANPTIWAPSGCRLAKNNGEYICENLRREDNRCKIYQQHPLDCQLYPFLLVRKGNSLQLGIHRACRFIQEKNPSDKELKDYTDYVKERLCADELISILENNPEIAADYAEDVQTLAEVGDIFETEEPRLHKLTLNDKPLIENYLQKNPSPLSGHNFAAIFIWRDLFDIFWTIIDETLCIFYQDKIGLFMPHPPQGAVSQEVVKKCFELMAFYNQNSEVSRIENVAEDELSRFCAWGFQPKPKDTEYLCLREDLANLSGGAFKHKRASYNHFKKNYQAELLEYNVSSYQEALELYHLWSGLRKDKYTDSIYRQSLEDSFVSFKTALQFYKALAITGYVVKVGDEIKACSFGYGLDKETFCILFEVCDIRVKGLAQFIFREFCRKLPGYTYINIMGASDLENLKNVKLSYRPHKEVKVYNIYQ